MKTKILCAHCGKPLTTQDQAVYRTRCENCYVGDGFYTESGGRMLGQIKTDKGYSSLAKSESYRHKIY